MSVGAKGRAIVVSWGDRSLLHLSSVSWPAFVLYPCVIRMGPNSSSELCFFRFTISTALTLKNSLGKRWVCTTAVPGTDGEAVLSGLQVPLAPSAKEIATKDQEFPSTLHSFFFQNSILYFSLLYTSAVTPLEKQELNQEPKNCPWRSDRNLQCREMNWVVFCLWKNEQMTEMVSVILCRCL